jgi:hypothetical protein
MQYRALACDYDGTLACDGHVAGETVAALERVHQSGRRLILVTGRELNELISVFSNVGLFEQVVAENGGLLYDAVARRERLLAAGPPHELLDELFRRGVSPICVGRVIVATRRPHEKTVLDVIRDLGLEHHVIFNKGAVMVLPSGINKATGLSAALDDLGLAAQHVVGVGDAENDHTFLALCGLSAAVANALPAVKEQADIVTRGDHGRGVIELIDELLANDLAQRRARRAGQGR